MAAGDLQQKQSTIVDALVLALEHLWQQFMDVANLKRSLPHYQAAFAATVRQHGMASGAVAAQHYREMRQAAGITDRFTPKIATPPKFEQVQAETDWATKNLWTPEPDVEAARVKLAGIADRMVLDVGRFTIENTVQADRKALGWARVPEPGACAFCAMLATRGAVYKSKLSASRKASGGEYHDHCRCQPEPVFTAYEPTAQVREWQALWKRTKSLNAFRKALGNN